MEIIALYVATLSWIAYCVLEGTVHEFIWSKNRKAQNFNNEWHGRDIHVYFTLQRMLVVSFLLVSVKTGLIVLVAMLTHPFVHNGAQYYHRFRCKGLKDSLMYDSPGHSSAKVSINTGKDRLAMFLTGVVLIIVQTVLYFI